MRLMTTPPTDKNHDVYFVPGLHRGLKVLEAVGRSQRPMSITELAQQLELSRSSVFRLVYTLQYMGFLRESADPKFFGLGSRVLNLGFAYLAKQDIIEIARRDLEQLRDSTGISTHLAIRDGLEVLFLDCIQTRTGFLSNVNVGARIPTYATPLGWLMLSELSHREIVALFDGTKFQRLTNKTPADIGELLRDVATAATAGFVFSRGIVEQGGCSVSAPIFDSDGHIVAAIDASGPESAFDPEKPEGFYVNAVMGAAAAISARLGYAPEMRARKA